jgi:FkbM family methyltransferase
MSKIDSINPQHQESTFLVSHPAIGELYCRNVMEAQGTLHEICEDQLYFQSGISVSPDDVILDVGANIGIFSLYAAKQGARIYAFEPMPSTFAVLELNVRLHGLERAVTPRNIGLSDRAEKKIMFHYPSATVCDAWTPQDNLFKYMADNWQNTLDLFKTADPERYEAIVSLGAESKQQSAIREIIEEAAASPMKIECEFDTLSGVIAQENIEFIDLLKLDAELADWEILNGVTAKDWDRIRQLAMEVHVASDVKPISQFLKDRGFARVTSTELKMGTGCIWATK